MRTQQRLLVLGAGTAGTMVANKVSRRIPEWDVTVVAKDDVHDYQPGYLFLPFGMTRPDQVRRRGVRLLDKRVERVFGESVPVKEAPPRPGDAVGAFANVDKARDVLGWTADLNIDDAIRSALAWGKKRKDILGYA